MRFFSISAIALGLAVAAIASAPASARPPGPPPPPVPSTTCTAGGVGVGDVTVSLQCSGPHSGNDSNLGGGAFFNTNSIFAPTVWTANELQKCDVGGGGACTFSKSNTAVQMTVVNLDAANNPVNGASDHGSWSADFSSILVPLGKALDIAIVTKTATWFSAYLIDLPGSCTDLTFSSCGGYWNTIGTDLDGSGTKGKNISHISIYQGLRDGFIPPPPPDIRDVPLPVTAPLLVSALGAFGLFARRRRRG